MEEQPTKNQLSERDKESVEKIVKINNNKTKTYGQISQKKRSESYKKTISRTQNELSPFSRLFSKLIHLKLLEVVGDFLAKTIARPNALLTGSAVSFFMTLAVYVLAKTIGFELSGFETVFAFIVGWIIGIMYDYFSLFSFKK